MKLSMKLALMMGSLLAVFCAFGIFALFQMGMLNAQSALLANRYIPVIVNSQRMNTTLSDYRVAEVRHIYSTSNVDMAEYDKTLLRLETQFLERSKAAGALLVSPQIQEQLIQVMAKWNEYYRIHNELMILSSDNRTAEAVTLLDDSRSVFDTLASEIVEFVTQIEAASDRASQAGDDAYQGVRLFTTILLLVITLLALFGTVFVIKGVLKQLGKDPNELVLIAKRVTDGDYAISDGSPLIGVYGNLVDMVKSLEEQIDNARRASERASQESENAKNATIEAENASGKAQAKTEAMLQAANQLEEVASVVSSATTQLSAQIEQSGRGAEQQAAMASETATAMEEMNATVLEVAKNAASASEMSVSTRRKAEEGAIIVGKSVHSVQQVRKESLELKDGMTELASHAQSINQIMGVISDIADQTNLLALNAAIEAARAGDAGRGFAVVADEVRKLAEKTMASTTDVGNAIKAIQDSATKSMAQVDSSVSMIEETTSYAEESGKALQEIVAMVNQTAAQVEGIATASEEQSAASEEISNSANQVNTIAGETAMAMVEASSAISDLAQQAQGLTRLIDDMKRG